MERASRGSEVMNAARQIAEDQVDEITMEDRTRRLESHVEHIKHDVQALHGKMDVANEKLANQDKRLDHLGNQTDRIEGRVDHLTERVEKVADAQVDLAKQVASLAATQTTLATKEELRRVEGELKQDLRKVEGELKQDLRKVEGELKTSIGEVEKLIERTELRLIKWVVGTALAAVTASKALSMLGGDAVPAAYAPSPIKSEAPAVPKPQ
jgi:chromosome segregation ATPase